VSELAAEGFEPIAVLSHLAKIGTSDPVEARASIDQLVSEFAFEKIGRAPARFDPDELKRVNAAVLHQLEYAAVKDRLAALDADKGEAFWTAVRANLSLLPEVKELARIVDGPVTPVIGDPAFASAAAELLPSGGYDASSWQAFTGAVKEKTGAKGKALFMPLRQALTGLDHGPEMAALFPLIGEERARKRLQGQTA
jgi:glutamyl-tRNA synthetase